MPILFSLRSLQPLYHAQRCCLRNFFIPYPAPAAKRRAENPSSGTSFCAGGGAGQAVATQACLSGVKKLVLVNRTVEKLGPLVARLRMLSPQTEIVALSFDDPALAEQCLSCDLIVNTSSVGLKSGDPSILPAACLKIDHLVYDTIYQPPVTPLLALAGDLGCRTANGISMLLNQGALAFQRWFPETAPLPVMRAALRTPQ